MPKECKHTLETITENIQIDNEGIKVAGLQGFTSHFKYNSAYFIILACTQCTFKEYKRLVVE